MSRHVAATRSNGSETGATEIDTLVVGAGPQALTVLSRWLTDRPAVVGDVLAVDPAGTWLRTWDRQFARQRIDVLRSPGVHHPDPDEMAFLHAHRYRSRPAGPARGSGHALRGPLRRPETAAFARFCRDLAGRTGLAQRVRPATVVDLRPLTGEVSSSRWEAELCDGAMVRARQVVWAGNPRLPCVPSEVELCEVVVHAGTVDVGSARPGQRIAVLGGGQTAGQLALGAARCGAEVAVVCREPLRIRDLDVDAGWLMDDHLAPFASIDDPVQRRQVVEQARRGSMTADLVDALGRASVQCLDAAGELSARRDGRGAIVRLAGVDLPVDRVWVATGSTPDLRADPVLARLAAAGAPHVDGWPVLDDRLRWRDGLVVIGALAALTLGPAAGNLGGARAAAELLAPHGPLGPARGPALPVSAGSVRPNPGR
ncbi:MAG: hypothetical protein AAFZ07_28055 [Actinomycetota bacterium]